MAFCILEDRFAYFFTNFGWYSVNIPNMSSDTKIWPSQYSEAPIPIVGIFDAKVICVAISVSIPSNNNEIAPAFSRALQSFNMFFKSSSLRPYILNLLAD